MESMPAVSPEAHDETLERVMEVIDLISTRPDISDADAVAAMVSQGISEVDAKLLIRFVPCAFCLALLDLYGFGNLPSTYRIQNSAGQWKELPLATVSYFVPALRVGHETFTQGYTERVNKEVYTALIMRSAEMGAFNQYLWSLVTCEGQTDFILNPPTYPGPTIERAAASTRPAGPGAAADSRTAEGMKKLKRILNRWLSSLFVRTKPINKNTNDIIHAYFATLFRSKYENEEVLSNELIRQGLSADIAVRLVAFIPLTFGRVQLAGYGMTQFGPGYEIHDFETNKKYRFLLKDEPIFVAANTLAQRLGTDNPILKFVAYMSAETDAAHKILKSHSSLSGVHFSEPLLMGVPLPEQM